jgi:glycosyltransferase involved in cell wall biosynthesis
MKHTRRINILFILNALKPRGAEQQLYMFIKALPPIFNIHIYSFSQNGHEYPELANLKNVQIYTNMLNKYYFTRPLLLFSQVRKYHYDAVITIGLGSALLFGRTAALAANISIIYSFLNTFDNFNVLPRSNSKYFDYLNTLLNMIMVRTQTNKIYRFFPNSKKLANRIRKEVTGYDIKAIYNGYDLNLIIGCKADRNENLAARNNKSDQHFTIIQVGELDDNKNPLFTVKALCQLKKTISNVRLIFVGDGPEQKSIKESVDRHKLGESVLLTGRVDRATCLAMMQEADVLVLTSKSESFPNVLIEAQLLGIPVVSFDVGAAEEIIQSSVNGFIVGAEDLHNFVDRIIILAKDKKLSQKMGRIGKLRISDKFSMNRKIKDFTSLFCADMNKAGRKYPC